MTTRKTLIINQYLRMSKDIENKIDKKILPSIDDGNIFLSILFSISLSIRKY